MYDVVTVPTVGCVRDAWACALERRNSGALCRLVSAAETRVRGEVTASLNRHDRQYGAGASTRVFSPWLLKD